MSHLHRRIGIIAAMESEAAILADGLQLKRITPHDQFFIRQSEDSSVMLICPGTDQVYQGVSRVGKVPATLATAFLIQTYQPTVLINCGTAGGMSGATIGDVIIGTGVTSHDIHIPLGAYPLYGTRVIPLPDAERIKTIPAKSGLISTGESFTLKTEELKTLKQSKALVKDMEAFAVVQTAREFLDYRGRLLVIKSVTDLVEHSHPADFEKNFHTAMQNLSVFIRTIISDQQTLISTER